MPRLSIVIPYLGTPKLLENTLVSVLENRPENCEILVVLNESYDDPYDLKEEVRFLQASKGTGLVESINLAARASRAPLVHTLACGAEVAEGWAEPACAQFGDPQVAALVPLVLDLEHRERIVAAGMIYRPGGLVRLSRRSTYSRRDGLLAAQPATAFYRKSVLEIAGPLDNQFGDLLAGVDLALTLDHAGLRTVLEPNCRVYVPHAMGWKSGFRRALEAERLYWSWAPYGGWIRSLTLHGLAVAGECLLSFPRPAMVTQLAGRLVGGCRIGSHRACYQRLGQARMQFQGSTPAMAEPHFARDPRGKSSPRRVA